MPYDGFWLRSTCSRCLDHSSENDGSFSLRTDECQIPMAVVGLQIDQSSWMKRVDIVDDEDLRGSVVVMSLIELTESMMHRLDFLSHVSIPEIR